MIANPTALTNLKKEKKIGTWKLEVCFVGSCGGGVVVALCYLRPCCAHLM